MSTTMIQIRNVPERLHREAKARAAQQGLTLSEFALQAVARELARPTAVQLAARIRALEPVPGAPSAATLIRKERAAR